MVLYSGDARFMTGETLTVSGGLEAGGITRVGKASTLPAKSLRGSDGGVSTVVEPLDD